MLPMRSAARANGDMGVQRVVRDLRRAMGSDAHGAAMKGFLWGFGSACFIWGAGALWLQVAKTTLLLWGQPGDAAGAVIMGAIAALVIALILMSPRARDTLTVGALLVFWAAIWAHRTGTV